MELSSDSFDAEKFISDHDARARSPLRVDIDGVWYDQATTSLEDARTILLHAKDIARTLRAREHEAFVERGRDEQIRRHAAQRGVSLDEARSYVDARADRDAFEAQHYRLQREIKMRADVVDAWGRHVKQQLADRIRMNTLDASDATRAVERWLTSGVKPFLLLMGGTGTGKTVAAINAIAGKGGQFTRATEIAAMYEPWTGDREAKVERLKLGTEGLLVVDDLGTEDLGDRRFAKALAAVIDDRTSGFRTLLTTNLTRRQLRERYGERFDSRMDEHAGVVALTGPDMRRPKPKATKA